MELQNFGISEHRIIINRHRGRSAAIQSGLLRPKPRNDNYHVTMQPRNHKHGFSLIELSIVFVVIGILMTGALTFVSGYTKGHQIKETRMKLQAIEQALIVHVRKYGHIPCPASRTTQRGTASFGVSPTPCNTAPPGGTVDVNAGKVRIGMVPVKRLGLPEDHAFDGWGNRITYAAIRDLAVDKDTYNAYTTTDTNGIIIIQDGNGNQLYPADDKNINAYAIISHGSDGKGAFNRIGQVVNACNSAAKDGENCDADSLFFDMPINDGDTESTYFNDYIRWKPVASLNMDANSTNISTATGLPDCAAGETLISNGAGAYLCGIPEGGTEDGGRIFEGERIAYVEDVILGRVGDHPSYYPKTPCGSKDLVYDLTTTYKDAKYINIGAYCSIHRRSGSAAAAVGMKFTDALGNKLIPHTFISEGSYSNRPMFELLYTNNQPYLRTNYSWNTVAGSVYRRLSECVIRGADLNTWTHLIDASYNCLCRIQEQTDTDERFYRWQTAGTTLGGYNNLIGIPIYDDNRTIRNIDPYDNTLRAYDATPKMIPIPSKAKNLYIKMALSCTLPEVPSAPPPPYTGVYGNQAAAAIDINFYK